MTWVPEHDKCIGSAGEVPACSAEVAIQILALRVNVRRFAGHLRTGSDFDLGLGFNVIGFTFCC